MRKKAKILGTFFLITFLAGLCYVLPPFYFNELELEFRKSFTNAYISISKAEQGITLRQQHNYETGDEETFSALGEAIENELDNDLASLEKASSYNKRQEKIKFLLPSKYQIYLELKEKALDDYHQLSAIFRKRKENEHLMTQTMMLLTKIDQSIYDLKNYQQWLQTLEEIPKNSSIIKSNADTLLANKHINNDFHDYIFKTVNGYEHVTSLYIVALENESWSKFDWKELDEFETPEAEVTKMFEELKTDWDKKNKNYLEGIAENNHELSLAGKHYNECKLALDPISKLLAMFSSQFPRIKIMENIEPTIVPENVIIDLVS